jgi:hypothetical protein
MKLVELTHRKWGRVCEGGFGWRGLYECRREERKRSKKIVDRIGDTTGNGEE